MPGAAGKTAITNVRVFDGQGLRPPGTVVIDGDRIGTDPEDAQVIDGDPLEDIRATRSIRRAWCGGVEHVPLTQG